MMRDDWVEVKLGEILEIERGGSPRPIKEYLTDDENGINWIKIGDTKNITKYIKKTKEKIKPAGLKKSRFVKHGDFILSNSMSFGKPYIMATTGAIHDGWLVLKDTCNILDKEFLYHVLSSPIVYTQFSNLATGSTVKNLNISLVSKVKIKLIPLPEQRAIVAKIEELFSSLDNGISDLNKVSGQLKIYRQAVLKKAFTGELTKEWRAKQTNLPTASELLQQIQAERQSHQQQHLTKWQEAIQLWQDGGKEGKKPAKPKMVKTSPALTEDELVQLPHLPKAWRWGNLGESTSVTGGLTKNSKRTTLKIKKPFLRVANVHFNKLLLNDMHTIGIKKTELPRVELKYGDLLLVEGNGSIDQIGRVAIWKDEIKGCIHQNHLIKARPASLISSKYLLHFLCSKQGRDFIIQVASSTSGLHTLNLTKVANLKIPICSHPEQLQIVQEIESRLSVCDNIEQSISASLAKAEGLRQSILKKAFAGELLNGTALEACRQEPDWQPASELLKQIKATQKDA